MEFQKRPMKSKAGPIPSKQSSHIKIPNNGIGLLQNAPALVLIRSKADCAIIWTRTIDLASQNNRLNSNGGHHRRRPGFTPMITIGKVSEYIIAKATNRQVGPIKA